MPEFINIRAVWSCGLRAREALTREVARDLEETSNHIDRHDLPARAGHVLQQIERAFQGLSGHPHRGELFEGTAQYRDRTVQGGLVQTPRVICRAIDDTVYVLLIADGRRDMRTLLERRLLQPKGLPPDR